MNRAIKILIALVIFGALGFFAYKNIGSLHKEIVRKAVKQEQETWQDKTDALEKEIRDLRAELAEVKGAAHPPQRTAKAFGKEPAEVYQGKKQVSFAEIERQVASFFRYLDNQQYVVSYGLKGGTYREFQKAVESMSKNPPIIAGEMDSLFRLLQNMAHFFRISGKLRIKLTKDILSNEADIIEPLMNTFYLWFTLEDQSEQKLTGRPSLDVLYVYSGYFLETLGGRSYLLRRDPKVRALTHYYCVLIVDKANDKKRNSFGLDIRPHIAKSYDEIKSQVGLVNQGEYLEKLDSLKKKYKISLS